MCTSTEIPRICTDTGVVLSLAGKLKVTLSEKCGRSCSSPEFIKKLSGICTVKVLLFGISRGIMQYFRLLVLAFLKKKKLDNQFHFL